MTRPIGDRMEAEEPDLRALESALLAGFFVARGVAGCTAGNSGFIDLSSHPSDPPPSKAPKSCTEDGQCPPPTPYCDQTSHQCIQCLADPNCTMGNERVCSPSGACVQCLADESCMGPTAHCNLADNHCVECLVDE